MRTVSNHFRDVINQGGPFYAYAEVTLANGTELTFDSQNDFYISGNKYDHSFTSAFPIGEAVCKTIDIGIDNHDNRYSAEDFNEAIIALYTEIDGEDDTPERLLEGIFNVVDATSINNIIEISAADNMIKLDTLTTSDLRLVALHAVAEDICDACGLTLATPRFNNDSYRPSGIRAGKATYRELLGYIAQVACGNAVITPAGEVAIVSYSAEQSGIISGGILGDTTSDIISGGELETTISDTISGNELQTALNYTVLNRYNTPPKIGLDDIVITGVSIIESSTQGEILHQYGTDGYVLKIENRIAAPYSGANTIDVDTLIQLIGDTIIGKRIRPFSGKFSPNPTIELLDNIYVVDDNGNIYQSFVTSNTFNYLDESEISNEVQTQANNSSTYKNQYTINDAYSGVIGYKKSDGTNGTIRVINGLIQSVS